MIYTVSGVLNKEDIRSVQCWGFSTLFSHQKREAYDLSQLRSVECPTYKSLFYKSLCHAKPPYGRTLQPCSSSRDHLCLLQASFSNPAVLPVERRVSWLRLLWVFIRTMWGKMRCVRQTLKTVRNVCYCKRQLHTSVCVCVTLADQLLFSINKAHCI